MVTTRGVEWRQQNVETAPFYTNKEVDHLIKETEASNHIFFLNNKYIIYTTVWSYERIVLLSARNL